MTVEGLAGDRGTDQVGGPSAPPTLAEILEICDGVLSEVGRRSHLFAWLRAPGAGSQEWLVVDAYYPGRRLVVICGEREAELEALYAELVPEHGLRLLRLTPSSLPRGRAAVQDELALRIAQLGPGPERYSPPPTGAPEAPRDGPMARVATSLAQAAPPAVPRHRPLSPAHAAAAERAARFVKARQETQLRPGPAPRAASGPRTASIPRTASVPRTAPVKRPVARLRVTPARPPARAGAEHPAGRRWPVGLAGLVLAVVLCAETYFGIGQLGLRDGHLLLAFGVALDVCSRALGTLAAARIGQTAWAWRCAVIGSPAVAQFALFGAEGPISADPAPLAGLVSVLAVPVIVICLLALLI